MKVLRRKNYSIPSGYFFEVPWPVILSFTSLHRDIFHILASSNPPAQLFPQALPIFFQEYCSSRSYFYG